MKQEGRDEKGRWKKGCHSPNDKGRPANGCSYSELLQSELEKTIDDTGKSKKETLVEVLVSLAINDKNLYAIKEVFDRLEGKPTQSLEHTVYQEENPLIDVLRQIIDGPESKAD